MLNPSSASFTGCESKFAFNYKIATLCYCFHSLIPGYVSKLLTPYPRTWSPCIVLLSMPWRWEKFIRHFFSFSVPLFIILFLFNPFFFNKYFAQSRELFCSLSSSRSIHLLFFHCVICLMMLMYLYVCLVSLKSYLHSAVSSYPNGKMPF